MGGHGISVGKGLVVTRISWTPFSGSAGGWCWGGLGEGGFIVPLIRSSGAECMKLKPSGSVSLSSLGISGLVLCKMGKDDIHVP